MSESAYIYILRCRGGGLYTGWTTDVAHRVEQHQSGKGGRYTRSHLPVELVYQEEYATQSEAMRRECEIKKMTRAQKLALIERRQKSPLQPQPHERPLQ